MSDPFFDHPILNSPYDPPTKHWELDTHGQPTQRIIESRRRAEFITPIPKPKKRKVPAAQQEMKGIGQRVGKRCEQHAWIRKADQDIEQLRLAVGFNKIGSILDRFLGPNRRSIVFKHFIDEMESKRQSGLRVDLKTATLGAAAGPKILKNTFYGDPA